jgi:hypothetical protein
MEEILDALRRIVSRWVETSTPIIVSVAPGEDVLTVDSTNRFEPGDQVIIESADGTGEPNLIVDEVIDYTHIRLSTPVYNEWFVDNIYDSNILLRKLINGMYVQGIYIGNPEVIPEYPAITIDGRSVDSEWMTLKSTKETWNIELGIHVQAGTYEDGYRFLLRMVSAVRQGLKKNFYPLVNDYDTVALTSNVFAGDEVIKVEDSSVFNTPLTDTSGSYPQPSDARAILENKWYGEETRVQEILGPHEVTIRPQACRDYLLSDNPVIIRPKRFLFNTWPSSASIGKTAREGSLLQSAIITWFAWEEVPFDFQNNDPHLR